jgi:hypothetical protein
MLSIQLVHGNLLVSRNDVGGYKYALMLSWLFPEITYALAYAANARALLLYSTGVSR